jgi:hypothetical protein
MTCTENRKYRFYLYIYYDYLLQSILICCTFALEKRNKMYNN